MLNFKYLCCNQNSLREKNGSSSSSERMNHLALILREKLIFRREIE